MKFIVFNVKKRKDFSVKAFNFLKSRGFVSERASFVCSFCLHHAKELVEKDTEKTQEISPEPEILEGVKDLTNTSPDQHEEIIKTIDKLCTQLKELNNENDNLNKKIEELTSIIAHQFVNKNMKISEFAGLHKDCTNLDSKSMLEKVNPILTSFLSSVVGVDIYKTTCSEYLYKFCIVVEGILHLKNQNLILPHCFLLNLIETFISGSKTVTSLNGKVLPCASDTTYRKWLKEQGLEKLTTPNIDLYMFIDNIGKYIVKNYRIKQEKNSAANVITASLNIPLKSDDFLQGMESLKPVTWGLDLDEGTIQERMEAMILSAEGKFREYRYHYITSLFQFLSTSSDMDHEIATSMEFLNTSELTRKCSNKDCDTLYGPRKLKCNKCGSPVVRREQVRETPTVEINKLPKYFYVGEENKFNKVDLKMAEPVLVNPNSYESIEEILDQFKTSLIDNNCERKWIFVGADGPPYCLMRRTIQNNPEKYDWVSIVSGKGHLNMNQLKTFFNVLDKIMLEPLGKMVLNFETQQAYNYFRQCKDNHKAWQAFEVFLHGTIMELICLYCAKEKEPTPLGFLDWQAEVDTPVLKLITHLTLNIGLGIYIQRIGDRNNDAVCSEAGRLRFLDMFYAFNHPIYREVEYSDLRNKVIYPPKVKELCDNNISFVTSNVKNSHQDGDFKLEEKIKSMKRMSPKGVVSSEMWTRVARSIDKVDAMVERGVQLLNYRDENQSRFTDISKEIVEWRAYLRNSNYLKHKQMVNIDGEPLNPQIINLKDSIKEKRQEYFKKALTVPLENIRYKNLKVTSSDIAAEITPFEFSCDDDNV